MEDIPTLDLAEDHDPDGLQFWGEDGGRLERLVNADDYEDDESSSDESEQEDEEEDDDDDADADGKGLMFDLPGHR
jgi:hypothetical protein